MVFAVDMYSYHLLCSHFYSVIVLEKYVFRNHPLRREPSCFEGGDTGKMLNAEPS